MEWDGWIECDAMRLDCDWGLPSSPRWLGGRADGADRADRGDWALHMPTELKPAVWGTSSMSHPLTGTLEELVTASVGLAIGHSGPCQPDAP